MEYFVNFSHWRRRTEMSGICSRCLNVLWTIVCFNLIVLKGANADCNSFPATGAQNNATSQRFAEGTTLEYFCSTGYDLIGLPHHRTCLGFDKWTEGPDSYSCQLKVTSIATACAVSVVIIVLFIVLVFCAVKRLKKPDKYIEDENKFEQPEVGQDNPYFIEPGKTEEDFNLALFDMERNGYISEGTTDLNYDSEQPSTARTDIEGTSTLPRPMVELPELPSDEDTDEDDLRYSTLPKTSRATAIIPAATNSSPSHIYDSIKQTPPKVGQSMQVNDETFTRL